MSRVSGARPPRHQPSHWSRYSVVAVHSWLRFWPSATADSMAA